MTLFLWVVLGACALDALGRLVWLARGKMPDRTPATEAVNTAFNAAMVVWAAILLSK